jgi:Fe2+ or Zn2+ uptake regulation protein
MNNNERAALQLLADHPAGLYGSDLVAMSGWQISRLTVYALLETLSHQGFVSEIEDPAVGGNQPRTRHVITGAGRSAIAAWMKT